MNSMEDQNGFDACFISEVPDDLKCTVCHLVLRQPVQIMTCGHRFCKSCFERVKGYSMHVNTKLCCPIDREIIDVNKVFDDTAIKRDVGNLQIMCSKNERGCTWKGDLRNIQSHADECQYQESESLHDQSAVQGVEGDTTLLNELCGRVGKCEDAILEKEKDVAYFKYNLHELKKRFNEKEEEVDVLKVKNSNMEEEMKVMKEKNQELKYQFEIKMENLALKNQLLENKVNSIKNEMLVSKKPFHDDLVDITANRCEVENVTSENVEFELSKSLKQLQLMINDEVKKLKDEVNNTNRETMSYLDKSLNKTTDEINKLSAGVTTSEKEVKNNFRTLNDTIDVNLMKDCQKGFEEAMKNIDNLENHVSNIENTLFCDLFDSSKDIVLQWKLQNYQYHFDIGEGVDSPVFYTQIKGYCFKLFVRWTGKQKEDLGLYLKVCCGSNFNKTLEPFNMQYILQMLDNKGNILSEPITISDIEDNRENFTIPPGENECEQGMGYPKFLTMPDIKDFIVNDMISIRCRITPA